jgi:hypothetical protein
MNKRQKSILIFFLLIVFISLACGRSAGSPKSEPFTFWTPTPNSTQTPIIIVHTTTPLPTQTPEVIVLIATSTPYTNRLCVIADQAVYLRPSASDDGYPILPLTKGLELLDLGGREGDWAFVQYTNERGEIKQGWSNIHWLGDCPS